MSDLPPPPPQPSSSPFGDDPKATAKAAKAYAKAQRPWYKKKRFIIPIVIVVFAIAASAGGGDDDEPTASSRDDTATTQRSGVETGSNNDENRPPDDIEEGWSCSTDEVGFITAKGRLTNHSSGTSSYIIEVTMTADGVQYATGTAFVNNVGAGVTAEWEANSITESRPGTTCELTSVDRFAS